MRPVWYVTLPAPGSQNAAFGVELENRRHALREGQLVPPALLVHRIGQRALQHPDVIVAVHGEATDLSDDPMVGKGLGPGRIVHIAGNFPLAAGALCRRTGGRGQTARRSDNYDSTTGKFKRGWGSYGIPLREIANPPEPIGDAASTVGHYVREGPDYVPGEPPEKQFRTPVHCVHLSAQGLVYVCDRRNDRIQVFDKQGKFVREILVHRETRDNGSVWTLNFSRDPQQEYLLVADGINQRIWVLRRRDGVEVSSFGAGYLHSVHAAGLDSSGNYSIGDGGGDGGREGGAGNGKSIQKFVLRDK